MSTKTPRMRRRKWPWVVVTLVALASVFALIRRGNGGQRTIDSTLVVKAKRGDLEIAVIETGKVQPREKIELKSKVAGQVERVLVEEGMKVKKGQVLLRLDTTDFRRDMARAQSDVARAQADVAQAKNGLDFALQSLERKRRGLESRGVAQIEIELAENEVKVRTVGLQSAEVMLGGSKVALGASEDRMRYTQIPSPIDGTVIQRGIQPGEVVTPGVQATFEGKALLTVADLSTLIVKTDLNQIDVAKVKLGQSVTLTLDALPRRKYEATITKIAPASQNPKGKDVDVFPVEATLKKGDEAIKPGMTADVRIHIETRAKVLSLPIEAVVREGGKSTVTKVLPGTGGQQRTEKAEVQVGARNDREIEILSGVTEGEPILIKPASSWENEYKM
ncbi:MAG: efflux RND transporter periplasmic adaptor subunit [Myxococcales bacterium]|nr:efflux RND transporter periplasmic adaptor subunit [Myxococcales bacterium]